MSELHPATRGFATADVYERGRPGYPAAAVAHIVSRLDLRPGRMVLDLAAGTGKLTRLLVPSGANVIAVEPVREMRLELERQVRGVVALAGTAERMPLTDNYAGPGCACRDHRAALAGHAAAQAARLALATRRQRPLRALRAGAVRA